ncbi:MAG TPA: hypothetical protein VE974_20985 [Thermoanaerobaculia bacterium]|nr:hypothetical protein [Thermoanaerobaculia bacterium]
MYLTETQHYALLKFIEWAASQHPDDIDDDDRAVIVHAITRESGSAGNVGR